MIVKDILPPHPVDEIMVRTTGPDGEDMLFGYCKWDGENLISLDGDEYYLSELVQKYENNKDSLTYWIYTEWAN